MVRVKQKIYNITVPECSKIVKDFRTQIENQKNLSARLVENDTISLDSLVWLVEATLNFKFGKLCEGVYDGYREDTIQVNIDIDPNTLKASADDVEDAYNTFKSALEDSSGSDFKVKFVDLEAYVYDPTIGSAMLIASVVKVNQYNATCPDFNSAPNYGPFNPATTYMAVDKITWGVYGFNSCSPAPNLASYPYQNAFTNTGQLNKYWNCLSRSHDCSQAHSEDVACFVNIISSFPYIRGCDPNTGTNPHPNELWSSGIHDVMPTNGWWCNLTNDLLTGAQLNTYLQNQILYAYNAVPYVAPTWLEPCYRTISLGFASTGIYYDVNSVQHCDNVMFWDMNVRWGKFICATVE